MSPPHNHGFKVRHGKGARLAAFSVFALAPFLPAPQRVSFCFLQGWGWGGEGRTGVGEAKKGKGQKKP